ncbi:hypothetical protein SERLA73DRAFT_75102 [Serpula lacrymans var. lacrymans S7.3]|uniref:Uncharacterized protein n=2 Tax=Serpula lacrymans var. lacrymans TaxID=341189 RepID=F8Q2K5_SERL3|nr:uncharacterized protein SERLADRAFT_416517 [Serpula lacrymans var. lacrymans S7.9]EGN97416.1 hypothetical protein SERLA73DRAFT_75102 [Serpula lacrymans var. lacrymans S7.3]EGO23008.1 hypothetical protein SERLADRAFT_416517 [Serpula lacrymans var. lacrymans S7.9]
MFEGDDTDSDIEASEACLTIPDDVFQAVSRNLANMGAISLDEYLNSHTQYDNFGSSQIIEFIEPPSAPSPPPLLSHLSTPSSSKVADTMNIHAVTQLHQACQRAFGKIEALSFDFIEENGPHTKQCILTVTRPDGLQRSYATKPTFSRKNEAKTRAATIAVEMGAMDFIAVGDPNSSKIKRGLVLAPLGPVEQRESVDTSSLPSEDDESLKEIETCCLDWRAGRVTPHWVALLEHKLGHKQGCALRIELSPHSHRVYASDTIYNTFIEAKVACAKAAIDEGVLDFIKHGNGQARPASPRPFARPDHNDLGEISPALRPPLTLQNFYDTLPRPFPESAGDKSAADINAPSWLNSMIQLARGSRLSMKFVFTSSGTIGLHGCLLRIERPGDSKSYLVDPRFPKRADAKAAVCLQAMSQGVGDYIRSISAAVEGKVTPTMRTWVNDHVVPVLASEYSKIKPGAHPQYDFEKDKDAYGCTMTVELSSISKPQETKKYSVPPDYRTKADAKIGVTCLAAEQGLIEYLRFRGEAPPLGYESPFSLQKHELDVLQRADEKRKEPGEVDETEGNRKAKKFLRPSDDRGDVSLSRAKEKALILRGAEALMGRYRGPDKVIKKGFVKGQRKNASAPGLGGTASTWGSAQSDNPVEQYNYGIWNAGGPSSTHGGSQASYGGYTYPGMSFDSNPSFAHTLDGGLAFGGHVAPPYPVPIPPAQPFPQNVYSTPGYCSGQPYYVNYENPATASYPAVHHSSYTAPPFLGYYPNPSTSGTQTETSTQPHSGFACYDGNDQGKADFNSSSATQASPPSISGVTDVNTSLGERTKLQPAQRTGSKGTLSRASEPKCTDNSQPHKATNSPAPDTKKQEAKSASKHITGSHVTALLEFCNKEETRSPQYYNEEIVDEKGTTGYKVWMILGKERFELPTTFKTFDEGRERVAKQVLARLRSKKGKM